MNKIYLFKCSIKALCVFMVLFLGVMAGARAQSCAISGGNDSVCVGVNDTLTSACSGGTWHSASPAIATVDTASGIVTGLSAGTAVISYHVSGVYYTTLVTVKALADPGTITGATRYVCLGSNITLTDAISGGTWSSSAPAFASVSTTGVVHGVANGSAIISYTVTNSCGAVSDTQAVFTDTVLPLPSSGSALPRPCGSGHSSSLVGLFAPPGGVFSAAYSVFGSVTSAGIFTSGASAGTITITYTVANGCGSHYITGALTVDQPLASISGSTYLCLSDTTTLTDATPGGTWSSSNPSVATIDNTGFVSSLAAGTTTISYSLPAGYYSSCSTSVVTHTMSISAPAPISATHDTICSGDYTLYLDGVSGGR